MVVNLKYTKTFVLALTTGIILTGCSNKCDVVEEHYHVYVNDEEVIYSEEESLEGYTKKDGSVLINDTNMILVNNNLFPLNDVIGEVKKLINDRDSFVQAKNVQPYIDENNELQFSISWRLLSLDEVSNYSGIVREGNNIKYCLYTLDKENNSLSQVVVDNLDDISGEYYINLDDFIVLDDASLKTLHNGKVYIRK